MGLHEQVCLTFSWFFGLCVFYFLFSHSDSRRQFWFISAQKQSISLGTNFENMEMFRYLIGSMTVFTHIELRFWVLVSNMAFS